MFMYNASNERNMHERTKAARMRSLRLMKEELCLWQPPVSGGSRRLRDHDDGEHVCNILLRSGQAVRLLSTIKNPPMHIVMHSGGQERYGNHSAGITRAKSSSESVAPSVCTTAAETPLAMARLLSNVMPRQRPNSVAPACESPAPMVSTT